MIFLHFRNTKGSNLKTVLFPLEILKLVAVNALLMFLNLAVKVTFLISYILLLASFGAACVKTST